MTTEKEISSPTKVEWHSEFYQRNCHNTAIPNRVTYKRSFTGQRVMTSRWTDWKRRIALQKKTTNPYSRSGYLAEVNPGRTSWGQTTACTNAGGSQYLDGYREGIAGSIPTSLSLPSESSSVYNTALSKFMAQVKNANTHMSGPTFIGELGKTIGMIRKPAKAISNQVYGYLGDVDSYARRRRSRKIRQDVVNQDLTDIWLQWSLGWSPLINETRLGAEALSRLLNDERRVFSVRGFASDEFGVSIPGKTTVSSGIVVPWEYEDVSQVSHLIKGGVKAKATGKHFKAMNLFGFNMSEFVPTVWNLLPLSWFVDYFVNVGDVLSATYTDISGVYWVSHSQRRRMRRTCNSFSAYPTTYKGDVSGSLGNWYLERKISQRFISLTGGYIPDLVTSVPGNPHQIANTAAIALKAKGISLSLSKLLG